MVRRVEPDLADATAPFELTLVDVNGDGPPDRVVQTPQGVFVQLNLGYSFAPQIRWSDGGFQTNESYSGTFGPQLGFSMPDGDFSAGLALSEAINIPRYVWVDVNGDGILDRLRSDSSSGQVMVAIGTNSGFAARSTVRNDGRARRGHRPTRRRIADRVRAAGRAG